MMITSSQYGALLTIIVIVLLISLPAWMRRRRSLGLYWTRGCMGIRWRRRFPGSSKAEIGEFLGIFGELYERTRTRTA
jgi:hypothetical protein